MSETVMKSKFNVNKDTEKRTCDGIVFDSKMEMEYYRDVLCPKVESGEVILYELQKKYELQPKFVLNGKRVLPITYVADFYIKYHDGSEVVVDVKGCPDSVAKIKRKLFWYKYPNLKYIWVTHSKKYGGWILYEECQEKRKAARARKKEESLGEKG